MLNKFLDLVFGKNADIFDDHGNVVHKFPDSKWKQWNDRFHKSEYDWRKHRGTERKIAAKSQPPK